jgi:hypothetical protein
MEVNWGPSRISGLRRCENAGTKSGSSCVTVPGCLFGGCALRLRQCIQLACKRGVLSRRSAAGSGSFVARHRQFMRHVKLRPGTATNTAALSMLVDAAYSDIKVRVEKRLAHRNASRGRRGCEPQNMSHYRSWADALSAVRQALRLAQPPDRRRHKADVALKCHELEASPYDVKSPGDAPSIYDPTLSCTMRM